jgi:XTP/dITP diphosphohydrolase
MKRSNFTSLKQKPSERVKELVIASNNKGKITEIKALTCTAILLLSLQDIGFTDEIAEPYNTFEENALTKANTINKFSGKNVFADDSGICINALGGEPGVHSAYYGGLPRSDEKNNNKLLEALKVQTDRSAFYKAVICLIWEEQTYFFEGICEGRIAEEPTGSKGFGYDPLFVPHGYDKTFGELPLEIKNEISHRGKAVRKMVSFLKEHIST